MLTGLKKRRIRPHAPGSLLARKEGGGCSSTLGGRGASQNFLPYGEGRRHLGIKKVNFIELAHKDGGTFLNGVFPGGNHDFPQGEEGSARWVSVVF